MAVNVVYEVLDSRDRDNLEASITSLNNKVYEKESGLKNSINTLNTNYTALKSYAESNINELKTDKISHSEIVNEVDSTTATSDAARNAPLSAAFGGVLFNRDAFLQSQINDTKDRIDIIADSDDETLDQLSEIVGYIKNNKSLIDGITTSKVNVSDIVDNWYSTDTDKPLSANQGNELRLQIAETMSNHNNLVHTPLNTRIDGIDESIETLTTAVEARILKASIADDLTTTDATKVLSAKQGNVLDTKKVNVLDIVNDLTTGGTAVPLSAEQGKVLNNNLSTIAEARILKTSIADNLTTDDATKVLSARQGKLLNDNKINYSDIVNALTDDLGGNEAAGSKPLSAKQGGILYNRTAEAIRIAGEKVAKTDIVDDLTTADATKVLSANQGAVLYGLIQELIERVDALDGGGSTTE